MTAHMDAALALLTCLEDALNARPSPPPANKIMIRVGEQVFPLLGTNDDECCTGLAWVRIAGTEEGPLSQADASGTCFNTNRLLTLEMGVRRCAPMSDASSVPTAEQWLATAFQVDSDHEAMEEAFCCIGPVLEAQSFGTVRFVSYTPVGPDGNCIGGDMLITVEADCGCP